MDIAVKNKFSSTSLPFTSRVWALGSRMVPARTDASSNHLVAKRWVWECTATDGVSAGATPPVWPATVTRDVTTVTRGGTTWTARRPGFKGDGTFDWTFATIYLDYALSAISPGDRILVSSQHSEGLTTPYPTFSFSSGAATPCEVVSVYDTAYPPAALADTIESPNAAVFLGTVEGVLEGTIKFSGAARLTGMCLKVGGGTTADSRIYLGAASGYPLSMKNCMVMVAGGHANGGLYLGDQAVDQPGVVLTWDRVGVRFFNAPAAIPIKANGACKWVWRGGWVDGGGLNSVTDSLISAKSATWGKGSTIQIDGVDFSLMPASASLFKVVSPNGSNVVRNSKLPANWTGKPLVVGGSTLPGERVELYNCDSGDTNYRLWIEDYAGSVRDETTVVRTGGASDGDTAISWKMATNASANIAAPLESGEIVRPYPGTDAEDAAWVPGTAKTISVEVVHDSQGSGTGGRLTDYECWLEVQYLGTDGSPLSKYVSSRVDLAELKADVADSTAAWTTTGLTAPVAQKLSVTIDPYEKGVVHARVFVNKPSATVYVCPKLVVA